MKTTFSQTFITVAFILLAALVLVGVSFQLLAKNFITRRAVESLHKDAEVITELVQAYNADHTITSRDFHIALTAAASVSGSDAVICDASGQLILCASNPLGCQHQGMMLDPSYLQRVYQENGCTDTGTIEGLYEEMRYMVCLPVRSSDGVDMGVVLVSSPIDSTLEIMNRITEIFVFVSVLVVVVSVIIMTFFAKRQSAPLKDMAKAASAFGHGDLTARVHIDGHYSEEIEELALAFNNMASSLQKSEYQRQEFVANVSHELKTPMTTIAGYVDGVLDGTVPAEKGRYFLQLVSDETKRLSRLVRSMLDVSRLQDQGGIEEHQLSRFDLTECAGQVLVSFEQKINAKSLQVQVDIPDNPVYIRACQDQITQVIYNLVDNAVKFCPEGGTLGLSVQEAGAKAYVSISNDGEVIPPEELPLVFDRFHKMDKSRSKNRDSWGLGLYIVKTIIGFHGENISVTSRDNKTTFTFTMPLVN